MRSKSASDKAASGRCGAALRAAARFCLAALSLVICVEVNTRSPEIKTYECIVLPGLRGSSQLLLVKPPMAGTWVIHAFVTTQCSPTQRKPNFHQITSVSHNHLPISQMKRTAAHAEDTPQICPRNLNVDDAGVVQGDHARLDFVSNDVEQLGVVDLALTLHSGQGLVPVERRCLNANH